MATLLRSDWQRAVEDELSKHAQGLQQPVQGAVQVVQGVRPPDPNDVLQQLQGHAQGVLQQAAPPVQQAQQGIVQLGGDVQQSAQDVNAQLQQYAQGLFPAAPPQPQPQAPTIQPLSQPQEPDFAQPAPTSQAAAAPVKLGQGQEAFISSLAPLAQRVAERTGIDPNVMIAIAANETGWGVSRTAKEQNNLFSISGPRGHPQGRWATYGSPEESFQAFSDLISTAPRYKQAWAVRDQPDAFVDELRKAGYVADEPGYPAQGWVDQVKGINRRLPQTAAAATVPVHEPSTPRQTPGTQIANAPDAEGRVFPLASAPSNKPNQTYHSQGGSDLMAPTGTPVLSMHGGTVQSVYTDNGEHQAGGNAVVIRGDDGLDYYYAHFDQPPGLKRGQRVETGEQIGAVGNSGNAWKGGKGDPHLHIGIGKGISNGVGSEGGLGQGFNAQKLLSDLMGGVGQATTTGTARTAAQVAAGAPRDETTTGTARTAQQAARPDEPWTITNTGQQRPVQQPLYAQQNQPAIQTVQGAVQDTAQRVGGFFSDVGTGAQQARQDLEPARQWVMGESQAAARARGYDEGFQQQARQLAQTQDARQPLEMTPGNVIGGAWNALIQNPSNTGIQLDDYMRIEGDKNTWIEQNNPLKDQMVVGGLTTMIAQQLTSPLVLATFQPTNVLGLRAGAAVTEALTPKAAAWVANAAGKLTSGAISNGLQNAIFEATQPGASPDKVGMALLVGAGLGGGLEAGAPAVKAVVRHIGREVTDAVKSQATRDAMEAFARSEVGELNLEGTGGARQAADELDASRVPRVEPVAPVEPVRMETAPAAEPPSSGAAVPSPASDPVAEQMAQRFLREPILVPKTDPRPMFQEAGLPKHHMVMQANLAEAVPEGTTALFHETSVKSARDILERVEAGPRNHTPIFTSDNRDLALGQGGKGVMLEFAPERANGGVSRAKPGLEFTAAQGMGDEYTISRTLPGAVSAIVVRNERQAQQLARSPRLARRFDFAAAEQTPEGLRIPYRGRQAPVEGAPPSRVPQPEAAAPPSAPPEPEPGFRAPEPAAAVSETATMPATVHSETGLPLNPDGTVTLYHGTTKEGAQQIRATGRLKADAEPDVYLTTDPQGGSYGPGERGYGDGTVVAVRVDPARLILDDEFPTGRRDFRIDVGRPGGSTPVTFNPDLPAEGGASARRAPAQANVPFATNIGGAVAGGYAGNIATPEDATLDERLRNIGLGASAGLLGTAAITRRLGPPRAPAFARAAASEGFRAPGGPPEPVRGADVLQARTQELRAGEPGRVPRPSGAPEPERAGNILLPKYVQPEVREIIEESWRADPARFEEARRGVVPDEIVRELAETVGKDVGRITSLWKPGQAKNAETIHALRTALADRAVAVQDTQALARKAPHSLDARNAYITALAQHSAVQDVVAGVSGEAGRSLRALRQPIVGEHKALQLLEKLAKNNKTTPEEFAEVLLNKDLSNPEEVARAARAISDFTVRDKLESLWYFALLSNPMTHIRNTVSNALVLGTRPVETLAAAAVDVPRAAVAGKRERFFGETPAVLFGYGAAFPEGLREAYRTMRTGITSAQLANPELATKAEPFSGRLADLTVNVPGRALQASDALFRNMHQQGSMYQLAYRQAAQEGTKPRDLVGRIAHLVGNPDKKMLQAATDEGAYRVFQQKGDFVNMAGMLREKVPALKFPLPFVQTPYNVGKYVLERTPLGLSKIATDPKGGGELSDRLARAAVGTATMYFFYDKVVQGNVTGEVPRDPTERDAFQRQGKQPYSIKVGDTWHSYQSLQPLTTLLAGVVAYHEAQKAAGEEGGDIPLAMLTGGFAFGRALLDQPWLQGTQELIDLMSGADVRNPDDILDRVSQYMQRSATSPIPSIVRALARAQDTTVRKPERGIAGIPQALAANIPFMQENAPAALTAFGEERQRPQGGLPSLFDPRNPSEATDDPLELELARLQRLNYNVQPGLVSRRVTAFKTPVELTEAEQRRYQRLTGTVSQQLLAAIVDSPSYAALTDAEKVETIEKVIERTRKAVRESMDPQLMERAVTTQARELRQRREAEAREQEREVVGVG